METSPFQRKSEVILDEFLSWEPSLATLLGCHRYDDRLPDWSERSFKHQLDRMREIGDDLSNIKEDSLSADELIDRDFALHFLRLRTFEMSELRMREKASFAAREIGDSLFFLFTREIPPLEQRLQSIAARLEDVPRFLMDARKIVRTPYRLWNEIQLESGERILNLLKEIKGICEVKSTHKETIKMLNAAVTIAAEAVEEHNKWLLNEVIPSALSDYHIEPRMYSKYLEKKGFGVTVEETLSMAEMRLDRVNREKVEISKAMVHSGGPREAIQKIREDHPKSAREVMEEYRNAVKDAREFVRKKRLVTFPRGERLHVIETPYFMRHLTPYAAQFQSGVFDKDLNGLFLVTVEENNRDQLEEHGRASIVNTSVHEGYPGHHLHGVCENQNPSLLRQMYHSPDFEEGWALYCEEMMYSQGYKATPIGRMTILNDVAFRLARQICDVKLSTGQMSAEEAAKFISAETGTGMKSATSEANAILLSPTYFSAYFVGKMGVMHIRDDVQKLLGGRFDLNFFHDALIYSGCMPVTFMRRAVAVRISEKYGLDLESSKKSVYEYAMGVLN